MVASLESVYIRPFSDLYDLCFYGPSPLLVAAPPKLGRCGGQQEDGLIDGKGYR
jgi:hypothetical protein